MRIPKPTAFSTALVVHTLNQYSGSQSNCCQRCHSLGWNACLAKASKRTWRSRSSRSIPQVLNMRTHRYGIILLAMRMIKDRQIIHQKWFAIFSTLNICIWNIFENILTITDCDIDQFYFFYSDENCLRSAKSSLLKEKQLAEWSHFNTDLSVLHTTNVSF